MKPTTALIIGAGALAILLIWKSSKSTTLPGAKPSATTANLLSLGGGILGGLGAGFLVSGGASSGSSTNTSAATETPASIAAGNYLADTTAASDTASGVVGFGGWDDQA